MRNFQRINRSWRRPREPRRQRPVIRLIPIRFILQRVLEPEPTRICCRITSARLEHPEERWSLLGDAAARSRSKSVYFGCRPPIASITSLSGTLASTSARCAAKCVCAAAFSKRRPGRV